MNILRKLADNSRPNGLGTKMRLKRHEFFMGLISRMPNPIMILDVGGTELYWKTMNLADSKDVQITLLNLEKKDVSAKNMISIAGNAINMSKFENKSFDIVFSNSVIEHVGDFNNQIHMAREVTRIGKRYFIQTPNYWFPMEPHFLVPGFQWLPQALRVWLIRHYDLGWHQKITDLEQARSLVKHTRLLTQKEFQSLFPKGKLYKEKILGLTKSFIVYNGWD